MAKAEAKHYVVVKSSRGPPGGRYSSRSGPAAAARKAASRRFGRDNSDIRLTVRETGTDREFAYVAKRVKLPKPVVREIDGKKITSLYKVEVRSA
jgi:hypothetical protein